MVDTFWLIMTKIGTELFVPCVSLYILFDLIGCTIFNKR